jgi:oligopeptidase A
VRFAEIQERLADVSQKFSENVLDATDQWSLLVTTEELAGVPSDVLEMTKANAEKAGLQGHQLSLKMPCYLPVMQFAHSSALREKM